MCLTLSYNLYFILRFHYLITADYYEDNIRSSHCFREQIANSTSAWNETFPKIPRNQLGM